MIEVSYALREQSGGALVAKHEQVKSYQALCELLGNYPWAQEMAAAEETGEGGGFYFVLGDEKAVHAAFQYVPVSIDEGFLFLNITLQPGLLKLIGRKTLNKDFDTVSLKDAQQKIKGLFENTVEQLFNRYR